MARWLGTVAVALLALPGCGQKPAAEAPGTPTPGTPSAPSFSSTEWGFQADFPSEPVKQTRAIKNPSGDTVRVAQFAAGPPQRICLITVAETKIDPGAGREEIERRFDTLEQLAVRRDGGRITASKATALDGQHPGREFSAEFTEPESHHLRCRAYLVGSRMYQVIVMGSGPGPADAPADGFLDSFRLTK